MSTDHYTIVHPEHFAKPRGYSNGIVTGARTLYVGGQIGWEVDQTWASDDFVYQFGKTLENVLAIIEAAGGKPTDLVKMTVFVTDLDEYRSSAKQLGAVWRQQLGKHYPAMALVGVTGLVEPRAKVEIEAIAALPEETSS
jgi:enamine deaminase RidA (YjgF/YER057c/UK114 family)